MIPTISSDQEVTEWGPEVPQPPSVCHDVKLCPSEVAPPVLAC